MVGDAGRGFGVERGREVARLQDTIKATRGVQQSLQLHGQLESSRHATRHMLGDMWAAQATVQRTVGQWPLPQTARAQRKGHRICGRVQRGRVVRLCGNLARLHSAATTCAGERPGVTMNCAVVVTLSSAGPFESCKDIRACAETSSSQCKAAWRGSAGHMNTLS